MPTEETGIRGHLRGLWVEIKSQIKKFLAARIINLGVLVIAGALALAASVLKSASEQRGMLLGGTLALLAIALLIAVSGLWSYLRRKPPEPPPVQELAPLASTGRLAEAHSICVRAFDYAKEYLEVDICQAATTAEQRMICELVRQHVLRPFYKETELLSIHIGAFPTRQPSREEFGVLVGQYWALLNTMYPGVLAWIVNAGGLIYGADFWNSAGYARLHQRHTALVQELQRVKAWPDLSGLASWQQTLAQTLPAPTRPADPPPPRASDQSPPPP